MAGRKPNGALTFTVIAKPEDIAAIKALPVWASAGRSVSPLGQALVNGDVVFLPGWLPAKVNALGAVTRLRKNGWRTHVRPVERDGTQGTAVWADKATAEARR